MRLFIGNDHRYLIPASALFGGILLGLADTIGRIVLYPAVVQAGVVMAFIGAPIFLALLVRARGRAW